MEDANLELLKAGLAELGLELPDAALQRLVGYHDFLLEYNLNVNLTGLRDERDSVTGNLLNSLAPWRHIDASGKTADVGSGGGLPGLPLAIALDMPAMTLIESKHKKCEFLREAAFRFAPGVRVLESDVNAATGPFGQILSVAYGSLGKLVKTTVRMWDTPIRVLAWKGRKDRIGREIEECEPSYNGWRVIPFEVPALDAERHLCVLEL